MKRAVRRYARQDADGPFANPEEVAKNIRLRPPSPADALHDRIEHRSRRKGHAAGAVLNPLPPPLQKEGPTPWPKSPKKIDRDTLSTTKPARMKVNRTDEKFRALLMEGKSRGDVITA